MISAISSNSTTISSMQQIGSRQPVSTLTDAQKSKIQDILSNYDPDNITEQDAKSIWQSFQDAGIKPQAGMREVIEAQGFDAESIRTMATGSSAPTPPASGAFGGSQSSTINTSALSTLKDILSSFDLNNLSSDDQTSLYQQLYASGLTNLGSMIDVSS